MSRASPDCAFERAGGRSRHLIDGCSWIDYRPAVALVRGRLAGESAGALLGGLASSGRHDRLGGIFPGSRPQNPKSGISERVDTRKGHMKK